MNSPKRPIVRSQNTAPLAIFIAAIVVSAPAAGAMQDTSTFRARLSTVPIDLAMQTSITGKGSATAVLAGNRLSVIGTFADLKSPATVARIHVGPKGIRGPSVFDLQVAPDTHGPITGVVDLTPAQIEDLRKSRFYIQLHSEKAPEGNLWGWLLPQDTRR